MLVKVRQLATSMLTTRYHFEVAAKRY